MRRAYLGLAAVVLLAAGVAAQQSTAKPAWAMKATAIEACSCPMFCQCYFNTKPAEHTGHGEHAGHGEGHFCRFNMAYKVDSGYHGSTDLTGAKYWIAGDLGGDFTKGMDWAVLHFDPSVTTAQREALGVILGRVFPVKWNSFSVGSDFPIEWTADAERARATLGGGKSAEITLARAKTGNTEKPVVMHNLKYFGAPTNDGFVMMPNEIEAYRLGDKAFEFKGTNGFMITIHIDEKNAPPAASH